MKKTRARIETVVANEDLVALKGALAHYRDDPAWLRTMPPLQPLSDARIADIQRAFAATGYEYEAAA